MFGVQWDLVLKYIETKGKATKSELKSNSIAKGNYRKNIWNIKNTKAKYSKNDGKSFTACPYEKQSIYEEILLTTGADESFSMMNIYDIAGNVWEWTLEYTSDAAYSCASRGGYYNTDGDWNPANYRDGGFIVTRRLRRWFPYFTLLVERMTQNG